ncbi:OmpA family protein [Marinobacter sp. SS21]|uniref:OmpA family protein n=1 Tax=Marinobacter sp. SS21 TaxID=2979460 RepID=UPI00232C26CD|nr:OmpA family protein [Marinobacter sp. SS21]MDC0662276.1 OmpA family protein [Marinobacter sp. SS21]
MNKLLWILPVLLSGCVTADKYYESVPQIPTTKNRADARALATTGLRASDLNPVEHEFSDVRPAVSLLVPGCALEFSQPSLIPRDPSQPRRQGVAVMDRPHRQAPKYDFHASYQRFVPRHGFAQGGAQISSELAQELDWFYWQMSPQPDPLTLHVVGHTNTDGSLAYNHHLGQRRAQAVADYLIRKGVAPHRLRTSSVGELIPVSGAAPDQLPIANRRVELITFVSPPEQAAGGEYPSCFSRAVIDRDDAVELK